MDKDGVTPYYWNVRTDETTYDAPSLNAHTDHESIVSGTSLTDKESSAALQQKNSDSEESASDSADDEQVPRVWNRESIQATQNLIDLIDIDLMAAGQEEQA
jgi:hypothetical protein